MSNVVENQNSQENQKELEQCVVCFKNVEIFSIGECNHPVCFECSSRMRVLCLQNECPICRTDLPKVIFSKDKEPFMTLNKQIRSGYYEKKYRISFADEMIQKAFYKLLENRCPKCRRLYHSFNQLKDHVRKEHELFYCDLCTEHLKIFCAERRCYTRTDLATHRRVGDSNDTSHRGHPICDYCQLRFLDKDELFRHLRREHFFCHFCDADGINLFYLDYESLRDHFKNEHYLCEEAECAQEQFTAAFRSEIDLKAHRASVHAKSMSKTAARQARTLDLDFSFTPRNRNGYGENSRHGNRRENQNEPEIPPENIPAPPNPKALDSRNEEEFPSLGNGAGTVFSLTGNVSVRHVSYGQAGLARTKENFPALGIDSGFSSLAQAQPSTGKNKSNKPSTSSMLKSSLPSGASNTKKSGMVIMPSSNRQNAPHNALNITQDFPALSTNGSKKNKNPILMEDLGGPSNLNTKTMNLVPAKHRPLVDDYVSVATKASKVNLVKKEENNLENRKLVVPKLSSSSNFPALGETPLPGQSDNVWVLPSVKKENPKKAQNSKKVAPAPDFLNQKKEETKKQQKSENEMKKNQNQKQNNSKTKKNQTNEDAVKNTTTKTTSNLEESNNKENHNNFPPLNANATSVPPGFSAINNNSSSKYPPGLNIAVNSVARNSSNMTFTNSTGENFSIPANSNYSYLQVPDSVNRNKALVTEFQKVLKTPAELGEFMTISKLFREGNCFPSSFYEHCRCVLGDRFDIIFPELLALLPDIAKQQSLYLVHTQYLKEMQGGNVTKKKQGKQGKLEVCATCKQVCLADDLISHGRSHILENSFPSLGQNSSSAVTTWKK